MIEISISGLVSITGVFFLIGMAIGVFCMVRVVKRELAKLEELLND